MSFLSLLYKALGFWGSIATGLALASIIATGVQSGRLYVAHTELARARVKIDAATNATKQAQADTQTALRRYDEAAAGAVGWNTIADERMKLLIVCQSENTRIAGANRTALVNAQAAKITAERALARYTTAYQQQTKVPDCAAALAALDLKCPALSQY